MPMLSSNRRLLPAFENLAPIVPCAHALKTARFGHVHGLSETYRSQWKSRHTKHRCAAGPLLELIKAVVVSVLCRRVYVSFLLQSRPAVLTFGNR